MYNNSFVTINSCSTSNGTLAFHKLIELCKCWHVAKFKDKKVLWNFPEFPTVIVYLIIIVSGSDGQKRRNAFGAS